MSDEARSARRDDRDCGGRPHRGRGWLRPPTGRDQLDICADEVGRQCRQASGIVVRPAVFDLQISPFGETCLIEPKAKSGEPGRESGGRGPAQHADPALLLRPTRPWQRCRSPAEQRKQPTAPHSMISSARSRIAGGIVRPIAWAVFRMMTSWNFVGCWTGRSAGLAPLRILAT